MEETELGRLYALARDAAHPDGAPARPCPCPVGLLADRDDGTVVRHGDLVLKAHAPDGVPGELRSRVEVAAAPGLGAVLLAPLPRPRRELAGRPLTAWPYGVPVDPDAPDAAPWEEAAGLLAALHRTPPPPGLPPMRAPVKAALAVERMRRVAPDHPGTATVLRAWRTLPEPRDPSRPDGPALCHGDFHLGQLVRAPHWRLIDVDDLGVGDPAWDLARPAAWFAAGLLAPEVWARFLGAYEAAGGPATAGTGGDPWARLDVPARALTVQTAALALAKSTAEGRALDEVEHVMIDTCARIASLRTELAPPAST
ncbi:phosphotransferase family protein [Streptomyces sp. NPDC101158]|uniref:phosphotransferase family protein n=1 Tax=Streptomyces sp. NPDC101158 TaxID=3366117 RepID=UPI0037FE57AB